jgi:hypothetical protein
MRKFYFGVCQFNITNTWHTELQCNNFTYGSSNKTSATTSLQYRNLLNICKYGGYLSIERKSTTALQSGICSTISWNNKLVSAINWHHTECGMANRNGRTLEILISAYLGTSAAYLGATGRISVVSFIRSFIHLFVRSFIHSFSSLSYDRSMAPSIARSPQSTT